MQHTYSSRRALNDNRQNQTEGNAEQRIAQELNEGSKGIRTNQRLDTVSHQIQTHKQDTETNTDVSDGFGRLPLDKHQHHDADDQGNGSQGIGIKQPQQEAAVGLDGTQTNDLCGNSGADVGTHNDGHSLLQSQKKGAKMCRD